MLNLLKYELLRRQKILIITAAFMFIAEIIILLGINKLGPLLGVAIVLMFLMVIGVTVLIFAEAIRSYSTDLNQKQGYMLFMTPNSGYKILGSKMIINMVTLLVFSTITFLFMYLNFMYAKGLYFNDATGELKQIADALTQIYGNALPGPLAVFLLYMVQLIEWFGYIMVAILAITLRKTLFAQSRHGGLLSFLVFIVVYAIMQTINFFIMAGYGLANKYIDGINSMIESDTFNSDLYFNIIRNYVILGVVLWLVYITIYYFISARLLNKRIDL